MGSLSGSVRNCVIVLRADGVIPVLRSSAAGKQNVRRGSLNGKVETASTMRLPDARRPLEEREHSEIDSQTIRMLAAHAAQATVPKFGCCGTNCHADQMST